jgi:uncharacterized protein
MSEKTLASTPIDLHRILGMLAEHRTALHQLGVHSLGLFGSYRTGTARGESDLDFLVTLERPSFRDYMDVKFFLEGLFGRKVDLVPAESLKPRIRERILAEVVYAEGLSPVPLRICGRRWGVSPDTSASERTMNLYRTS